MAEEKDLDQDRLSDSWLTSWEQETLEKYETESNMEDRIQAEREVASQRLWQSFQNAATNIAQLYRDRHQGVSLWVPFQNAASSVTVLYKDSIDACKKNQDLGTQGGHNRRTKDLLAWAKKRRRHIRREDLIAYLCSRSPPPRHKGTPPISRTVSRVNPERSATLLSSPRETMAPREEPDLQPFKDALALHGLNGAMSNISVGYRPTGSGSPGLSKGCSNLDELSVFVMDEISRHCDGRKRTSSNEIMDSPTRKRSRLL